MDDITTVIGAVGSTRVAVFGHGDGGPIAMLFAATYPERTEALVLSDTFARIRQAVDYPVGLSEAAAETKAAALYASWGREDRQPPARSGDFKEPAVGAWRARFERLSLSPGALETMYPVCDLRRRRPLRARVDPGADARVPPARQLLASLRVRTPSGGAHRRGDVRRDRRRGAPLLHGGTSTASCRRCNSSSLASMRRWTTIACSRRCCSPTSSDRHRKLPAWAIGHGATCLPATMPRAAADRALPRPRDRDGGRWLPGAVRRPGPGVRSGLAIRDAVRALGLDVRAGLHTGECERMGDNVGGIAVHIGARIAAEAAPGEVLASSTVKDLVVGSGLNFQDRDTHALKGVEGEWRLFAAAWSCTVP